MAEATATANPLRNPTHPIPFDRIKPEHVVPAVQALIPELRDELRRLEASATPSFHGVILPLERLWQRLDLPWTVISHLMSVRNTDALRAAYERIEPELEAFRLEIGQSRPIYEAIRALREEPAWSGLDESQQRVVRILLLEAESSGVSLKGDARKRFNEIKTELAKLSTIFSNNVLDATKAFSLMLTTTEEIAGLPVAWRQLAAQNARGSGHPSATAEAGPWRITLDGPCTQPILRFADSRELRETIYRALMTRASSGQLNNEPHVERILALRQEAAHLLGYETHAERMLARRVATSVSAIDDMFGTLRDAAWERSKDDIQTLTALAKDEGQTEPLQIWDFTYWGEKLRAKELGYDEEQFRPYFPFPHVLEGLFDTAWTLFGVQIKAADGQVPVWHPDVRYFHVLDENQRLIGALYLDPYTRPAEKRGGAWQNGFLSRSRAAAPAGEDVQNPVATMVCNQTPPVDGRPAQMSFGEVRTLFHEFGHAIHHLLASSDYGFVSGTSGVEWDAIEVPSMFMENWCHHRGTLKRISRHVDTGEPLPDAWIDKINESRKFRSSTAILRILRFSSVDLELHHRFHADGEESIWDVQRRVDAALTHWEPVPEDRFLCGFDHIFAGGYSAGYYSYLWANVMSADLFGAFEEAGVDDVDVVARMGREFRDGWLAPGGSRDPLELFVALRGREPSTDALLRHLGLNGDASGGRA